MLRSLYTITRLIICLILLLVSARSAQAQLFHINYVNSKIKDADLATLNQFGKFEANFYNQVFNTNRNDSAVVNIMLYGHKSDFTKVQRNEMNTTFFDGFYSNLDKQIYLYKSDDYIRILLHETSHNLLHNNYRNPPKWLNEGIANILANLVETEDHQIMYVPQAGYIRQVRDSISKRTFNLSGFFATPDHDWMQKDKAKMLYATAYSVIYFLISQREDYLAPMLVLMQQGYSTGAALRKVFGSTDNFTQQFFSFYINGPGRRF